MKYYSFFAPISKSEIKFIREYASSNLEVFIINDGFDKWQLKTYCSKIVEVIEKDIQIQTISLEDFSQIAVDDNMFINGELLSHLTQPINDENMHYNEQDEAIGLQPFTTHHIFDDVDEQIANYIVMNEMFNIDKQIRLVFNTLSYERFKHVMRVVYRMRELVALHDDLEPQYAYFAALFHDYSKEMPIEEQKAYMQQFFPTYIDAPAAAYHGFVAATELSQLDDELDDNVFEAIAFHTIGIPHWNRLGLALFVADYCEFGRGHHIEWKQVWELAQSSLEDACLKRVEQMSEYLGKNGQELYWTTENMLQWLKEAQ